MARTKDVIEHDCMNPDCYHDWDVRGDEQTECPRCNGTSIVRRLRSLVSFQNLMQKDKLTKQESTGMDMGPEYPLHVEGYRG